MSSACVKFFQTTSVSIWSKKSGTQEQVEGGRDDCGHDQSQVEETSQPLRELYQDWGLFLSCCLWQWLPWWRQGKPVVSQSVLNAWLVCGFFVIWILGSILFFFLVLKGLDSLFKTSSLKLVELGSNLLFVQLWCRVEENVQCKWPVLPASTSHAYYPLFMNSILLEPYGGNAVISTPCVTGGEGKTQKSHIHKGNCQGK